MPQVSLRGMVLVETVSRRPWIPVWGVEEAQNRGQSSLRWRGRTESWEPGSASAPASDCVLCASVASSRALSFLDLG